MSLSEEAPLCRICFEGNVDKDCLLSPCKCDGTVKYVHQGCLSRWYNEAPRTECELCQWPLSLTAQEYSRINWTCISYKQNKTGYWILWSLFVVVCLLFVALTSTIYYIPIMKKKNTKAWITLIGLLCFCSVCILIAAFRFGIALALSGFLTRVTTYRVKFYNREPETGSFPENTEKRTTIKASEEIMDV
ncbi:E3-MARCH4-like protein [Vombatid gammaherpesvirus 1]|uniref:E3-MARCH4-like protein n=1 Tax=Vombatid gammaherpesvirus 1 TaxID=2052651 RepID=A0A3Q8J4G1_9GAMA|nr:E3-MARCH4-like protein [Vombatid gammaherpesvirus 1]AZB49176.1 E3-MARCH4-like protein [Vombatid gammaherpesvirus 1]